MVACTFWKIFDSPSEKLRFMNRQKVSSLFFSLNVLLSISKIIEKLKKRLLLSKLTKKFILTVINATESVAFFKGYSET